MLLSLLACQDDPSNGPPDTGDSDTDTDVDSDTDTDTDTDTDSDTDTDTDSDTDTDTGPKPWLVPDFALVDLNTASPTHGHTISPREHKGHVSGWYFIHAD
jgi:hypothetical protein